MKALVWHGRYDVKCDTVPDPVIEADRDAIVKVTSTAICGSDLHLYDGYIPTMEKGDILGHEFMGEVVEVGKGNKKLKVGDRVVVPFTICCGECFFLQKRPVVLLRALRTRTMARWPKRCLRPTSTAGLFGYSHLDRRFFRRPGPNMCACPMPMFPRTKCRTELTDEQVLFLTDIFPTGYMAAENCRHRAGRYGRDLGRRPGWPVRDQKRLYAGRRAGGR